VFEIATRALVLYYAYLSFKAIESRPTNDDTQWLTFWVIFAIFYTVEYFVDFIMSWIPFYNLMKIGVFVFLGHFYGAEKVYRLFVKPIVSRYEPVIDQELADVQRKGGQLFASAKEGIAREVIKQQQQV